MEKESEYKALSTASSLIQALKDRFDIIIDEKGVVEKRAYFYCYRGETSKADWDFARIRTFEQRIAHLLEQIYKLTPNE